MKVKKNIHCYDIEGTPYLLPVGQGIMDHEPCLSTNAVGKLIWEGLERGDGEREILDDLMREFEATEEERPILKADMDAFISVLHQHSFFETPWREPRRGDDQVALIGPLAVRYHVPEALYKAYFLPFAPGTAASFSADAKNASCGGDAGSAELAKSPVDQTVTFCDHRPFQKPNGMVLVRSNEVLIMETEDSYVILPLLSKFIHEIQCSKDGHEAFVFGKWEESSACLEECFSALRFPFLLLVQAKGLSVMHSASLLYEGKAWLFSGHSGSGKSTHVGLWNSTFQTPWINGDLNLLGTENGQAVCYGLPWCGTSGISTPGRFPLGGITFLKQAPYDKVTHITGDAFALAVAQRMITPNWTAAQMQQSITAAERICPLTHGFRLECTKDPSAAIAMKAAIDQALSR